MAVTPGGILFFRRFSLFVITVLAVFLFCSYQHIYCQETGFKYIRNYSPKEYDHKPQNWSIVQDKDGIIYVGNQGGLLQYDGVSWRLLLIPNWNVRSLAIDKKTGTVCLGGNNEIGFLDTDVNGTLKYVSLVGHLKKQQRNFGTVWETFSTAEGVYFQTDKFLFRWDSRELKVWEEPAGINAAFSCGGELFIRRAKVGIMKMEKDRLTPLPGGKIFAEKSIFMMVRHQPGTQELLIGTREDGFYTYNGSKAVPFHTEANKYLKKNELYNGIRLLSGDFAMATRLGGLVIVDPKGKLKDIFTKASGLRDNGVKYVFEDFQGNLWLALVDGISKIEYKSPISIFDERSELPGLVQTITRHGPRGILYAGTTSGLYYSIPSRSPGNPDKFHLVPKMSSICWSLHSTGDSLLAATDNGLFQVGTENNILRKISKSRSFVLLKSRVEPNRIWVGTDKGLLSLYLKNQNGSRQWTIEHQFKEITEEIRTIAEDREGNLWLGTLTKGVLKVDFTSEKTIIPLRVNQYGPARGLPEGEIHVFWAAEHIMIGSKEGIFRLDRDREKIVPDAALGNEFTGGPNGKGVFRIVEDINKDIWFHSLLNNIKAIYQPDGTYVLNKKPFLRIPTAQVNAIYPDPGGDIVWFGGTNGLLRYDMQTKKKYDSAFRALIRKVVVNGKLIFDGYNSKKDDTSRAKPSFPVIEYKDRNLRFEFAAPFFEGESNTLYRYWLDGYEDDWSNWTTETRKDYTNLDSGMYSFRVQAGNVYRHESKETFFQFTIFAPWYKTWWALSIDALILFLLMFLIIKWRSGKLEREKQKLEQTVKDRTKEINKKNQQLEKQTVQLKEQSEKLKEVDKVKSRFFANISHEFRTPLTLIMGPLEQMLSQTRDSDYLRKYNLMLRNSQRLLGLINQLLELSKFESGKIKLHASRQNIILFLKGIIASFDPVAAKNELALTFHAREEECTLYFDPGKLEEAIFNILSNAVKFTPPGGVIIVAAVGNQPGKENFPSGSLDISISDTGPGIPRDQLANIFDRFYQSDVTYEHHRKGSGIGLSIAKELIELHHGKINVHSRKGKGTEFIIRLPLGKEHLKPDEIVETTEVPIPGKISFVPQELPAEAGIKNTENEKSGTMEMDKDTVVKSEKDIILVVEDSADVRDYIRSSLEPLYTVLEAKDGREGIQKAGEFIPDLIVSDIMMPEVAAMSYAVN